MMSMNKKVRVAEYILPGHPDKLCDAIADALVQQASGREKRALAGVEVAVHRNRVFVTGRLACADAEEIDVAQTARDIYRTAGYDTNWPPGPSELQVTTDLCLGPLLDGEAQFRAVADDQSIITGYAVDIPGTNYLPPEHWLAWRLARGLQRLRSERSDLELGPDGKLIVFLQTDSSGCSRLVEFSASLQQLVAASEIDLHRAVLEFLASELSKAAEAIPGFEPVAPEKVLINGAGNFAVGGPEGDNGLSGKKLVVDAYGPRVPIGGGALCGKDFYKADRAGAIIARRLAKAVVMTGAARECTATVAFLPGAEQACVVSLRNGDGDELDSARWAALIDLSLQGAGDRYTGATDLVEIARNGHFTSYARPWEGISFNDSGCPQPALQTSAYA